jgi:uncharacterized membrane protein YvbJ
MNTGCTPRTLGSLHRMAVCENCGESLDPRWKFCIHCGAKVVQAETPAPTAIPAAIRPEDAAPPRKRRLDWQLGLGLAFAVIGVAMIVYLVVVLIVPHGG